MLYLVKSACPVLSPFHFRGMMWSSCQCAWSSWLRGWSGGFLSSVLFSSISSVVLRGEVSESPAWKDESWALLETDCDWWTESEVKRQWVPDNWSCDEKAPPTEPSCSGSCVSSLDHSWNDVNCFPEYAVNVAGSMFAVAARTPSIFSAKNCKSLSADRTAVRSDVSLSRHRMLDNDCHSFFGLPVLLALQVVQYRFSLS